MSNRPIMVLLVGEFSMLVSLRVFFATKTYRVPTD
jgi:hypothetical protein